MKLKALFLKLCFILSFFILLFPISLGVFYNIKNILYILNYEENIENADFNNIKNCNYNFRKNFLEKTNNVFGIINFCNINLKSAVYYEKRDECFSGSLFNSCIIVNVKNSCFFENCFNKLEEIKVKDFFNFNVFGTNKKFEVEEVKTVFKIDESIYCKNEYDGLIIMLDVPYGINCNRLLIKAKCIGIEKGEVYDFFSLFYENKFLVIVSVSVLLFLFIFLLFLILKFFLFLNRRKNVVKIKYVAKRL